MHAWLVVWDREVLEARTHVVAGAPDSTCGECMRQSRQIATSIVFTVSVLTSCEREKTGTIAECRSSLVQGGSVGGWAGGVLLIF